jgi:hypothetical protein
MISVIKSRGESDKRGFGTCGKGGREVDTKCQSENLKETSVKIWEFEMVLTQYYQYYETLEEPQL